MAYTRNPTWQDYDGVDDTLITAAKLENIEQGIVDAHAAIVTDHGALTGLGDDDHTQYHNDARGDARYYTKGQVDSLVSGGAGGAVWGNIHAHATANMVFGNATVEPCVLLFAGDSITADGKWDEYFEDRIAREYTPGTAKTHAKISYDANPWVRPTTPGVYGYDLAVNGAQSNAYMRSGLVAACVEDLQPQLIFHGIGSNDHIADLAPALTTANIDAACLELDAVLDKPSIHVIWAGMTPAEGNTYPWQDRVEAMKAAADLDPARRMFVDLGPYFDALGTGTASDWWGLSDDALHMDTRAQYMFAELMHRALHGSPPVGVLGSSPSPALPYSGTTTTTTTAATTTTTTTAEGTTTTTTTAEGTTTTTTTAATTTTTTTAAGTDFAFLQYERKTGSNVNTHTFAGMSLGSEAAARTIIAVVIVDGHYLKSDGSEVTINGVAATQDHAQTTAARSIYIYRATVPTGTSGDVVVSLAGNNAKVSVGLWRASGAVTERVSAGHPAGATLAPTAGDFVVYGFIGGDTVTNCTERGRSSVDSSVQIVADRVAPGGSYTATSGTGMAAAAGAAYYLTP